MREERLDQHPILPRPEGEAIVPFYWNGMKLLARPGEMSASQAELGANILRDAGFWAIYRYDPKLGWHIQARAWA